MSDWLLQISAGVGPREAGSFGALLARRLERLAADRGLAVLDVAIVGDEVAPRSVTVRLHGDAPAALNDQLGTHALIARSAQRGRAARKRWFVAVTLHASSRAAVATVPPARDLRIMACRASGPGGQHVNKTASAVRIEHVPTGLVVRCAADRSQHANRATALARLAALLDEADVAAAAAHAVTRRAQHYRVVRGAPVVTYVLDRAGELVVSP
jgi:putative peptide chain release factor H